uniref:Uncharacterized protein n=1 Tax=Strombidium rassoulzadegani TaxID=1082188 RepID=A0A7S3FUS3_9SPIT|mmetsp:Transcript_2782/g.4758  ORF Transcript_2782/g.4758 Transcript_2782/m.4758 type:complete len:144 (+) Transcript_2782:37-468(+)
MSMFKEVQGSELSNYDQETIDLYRKRENDPRVSLLLKHTPRPWRHNLSVEVEGKGNPYIEKLERDSRLFNYKFLAFYAFWSFSCFQFTKAYYPYGIIARRSIPTTLTKQLSFTLPITACFIYVWYDYRERGRQNFIDLTSDEE